MRCNHCKSKMKPIKNDFKQRERCKTCWKLYYLTYDIWFNCRKDIYTEIKEKWVKQKIAVKEPNSPYVFWKLKS